MKKVLIMIFLIIILFVIYHYKLNDFLTLETIQQNKTLILYFVQNKFALSLLIYTTIYLAVALFQLPGITLLVMLAGAVYGFTVGFLTALFCGTINGVLVFILARYLFNNYFQNKYKQQLKKFNSEFNKNGPYYIFLMHITPLLPYQLINIFSGLTTITLKKYILPTFLGIIPHALIYSSIGYLIWEINSLKDLVSINVFILSLLAVVLPFLLFWRKKTTNLTLKH